MIPINISPFDKKDLLELLDYAKEKKQQEIEKRHSQVKWSDTKYWCMRIDQLKKIINGYSTEGSVIQSSFETIDYEPNQKQKDKKKYKKSLESDIEDVFDSKE